ncbi:hypothetical protein [Methylobacterium sp. CM6257]|jgi:hypothetical protein
MSEEAATAADRRHWFYDNRVLVCTFCLLSFMAIFWEVSQFEGFQPIFTCASEKDLDRGLLTVGMEACMAAAGSRSGQERCMRTAYLLACTKERWR